jgi:hypothetical protein
MMLLAVAGCSSFDRLPRTDSYILDLTGFSPVQGKSFQLKLTDTTTGETLAMTAPTPVPADGFTVNFPHVIQDYHNYRADLWVDVDGNGMLDHSASGVPAGQDASWSITGTGRGSTLRQTFAYSPDYMDITPF